jgi:hypothetical protein
VMARIAELRDEHRASIVRERSRGC